ncbi:MAG TPA: fumarylacetoacetate hydrolase family protein [Bryobacteraceae bacterium]|nr:fumarylacetoacetate hydrolase family protein [Bryobacteraceae bacterium]
MKLCTFEVSTHLGRHTRVGAYKDGRIIDLNFATAWYLAQQGESEPQVLADALVPFRMLDFLRAGLRALHTSEELFMGAGPAPADWWKIETPPRGPNDETLVYHVADVRLRAPLPNPARLGTDEDVRVSGTEPELKMAAVIGKQGTNVASLEARHYIGGFTGMNDIGARYSALGPCLVTPDEIGNPYSLEIAVRVNGEEFGRTSSAGLRPKFEQTIETLSSNDVIFPGDVIAFRLDLHPPVKGGDVIELEIEKIGTLRTRVV